MPSVRNLRKLKLSRVDLVPKGSNPGAHIALFKEAPDTDAETNSPDSQGQTNSKENPMSQTATETPAATEEVEATTDAIETTEANTEVVETPEAEAPATEPTAEVTPEPVAAGVEKSEPDTITKAEAETLRKEIADLKADKRRAEFIAKAEKDFGALGNTVPIAEMLMKADESFGESETATLESLLKGLVEQAETGALFSQFAKADADPSDREAELNKLAAERVEKGEFKHMQQARVAVMDAHPELRPDNTTARS